MSKGTAFSTLLGTSFRKWLGAKGFWLVVLAALFPVALTGAWAATHTDDVAATAITITPEGAVTEGDNVTFTATIANVGDTAVGAFNASLSVGRVTGNQFTPLATESVEIDGLDEGGTREVTLEWRAQAGAFYVLAFADSEDALGEVEELNNQKVQPLVVRQNAPAASDAPNAPGNLTGTADANVTADLAVTDLSVPEDAADGESLTFTATVTNEGPDRVENATVVIRTGFAFQGELQPAQQTTEQVSLGPGESTEVVLEWPNARRGGYWVQAYVITPNGVSDPDGENNAVAEPFAVQPSSPPEFPEAPENATIKDFYYLVLTWLVLPILVPFIALFYAGGVISDEKDDGTLAYLLTRPFPKWMIPTAKFIAGFVVALVALLVGLAVSYGVLFGFSATGADASWLTTPVATAVLALLAYGGLFTLMGVIVDRPYLVGVAFVLGWEVIARNFVPWVENLTVIFHVRNLFEVTEELALAFAPDGLRPLYVVLAIGIALLGASMVMMQRREFDV